MEEGKAKVTHYSQVPAQEVGPDAPGVTIRSVIDSEHDGAPNYALRVLEVEPGGHTPEHEHPWEHENYVLEGQGRVLIGDEWHEIGPGSVVFVPAKMRHTYANAGDTPLKFLCGIPVPDRKPQPATPEDLPAVLGCG
jgi:quercetin dioxygenase-like cupin family protein